MKKPLSLTFACIIITTCTFSQTGNKANISLSIGAAFPTADYANSELGDQSSGFARTGQVISISYTKPVSKDWSLLVKLSAQSNPINTDAFESGFSAAKIYQGIYFGSTLNNPPPPGTYLVYPNWKFKHSSWHYAALQLGAVRQFSLTSDDKTLLVTHAAIGALYAASPHLQGQSITDTATAFISQNKNSGFGLIYSLGIGLNHSINKTFFLTTTVNYSGTNQITFKNVKATLFTTNGTPGSLNYNIRQSIVTTNGRQSIGSINLSVGVGIFL